MKIASIVMAIALTASATAGAAQEQRDPIEVARESGVCGDADVISAVFIDSDTIEATCDDDAVAFVPLAGPLAALLGVGLLAASGGGSTVSTNGTN